MKYRKNRMSWLLDGSWVLRVPKGLVWTSFRRFFHPFCQVVQGKHGKLILICFLPMLYCEYLWFGEGEV